jgi:hypothetical protein
MMGILKPILTSNSLWTICSGIFDDNGNMWVLENSLSNEVEQERSVKKSWQAIKLQAVLQQSHIYLLPSLR